MTDQIANKMPISAKMVAVNWAAMEPGLVAYANNLTAQFDGKSVHLAFVQVNPPLIFGANDAEKQEQLNKISSVPALPVARLVVPLEDFRTMVRALQEQLSKIDTLIKP
jgi:hypothetical protein